MRIVRGSGVYRAKEDSRQTMSIQASTASGADIVALSGLSAAPNSNPARLVLRSRGWAKAIGFVISASLLVAVFWRSRGVDASTLAGAIPANPLFWATLAICYVAGPFSEWLIFRRLWRIPADGFIALVRKRISNEILFGYSGELYFYAWARRRGNISGAPFGAIKDVAILSAIAGNVMTLAMFALCFPVLGSLDLAIGRTALLLSAAVILLPSLAAMLFRRHLFSLPAPELRAVLLIHGIRLVGVTGLTALLWHLTLPTVALGWWASLAALRLLVTRLPFVPNKDLLFAGAAGLLFGHDTRIAALMALTAALFLCLDLLIGGALAAADLARSRERPAV